MGWKTFKEKFKIGHTVQITEKGLCIGSIYVHDLVVIDMETGRIKPNRTFDDFLPRNYPDLYNTLDKEILDAINAKDSFERSIPVYTYDGAEILEKFCEEFGWPNITHDGCLMYENTYFTTRKAAIEKAIKENKAGVEIVSTTLKNKRKEVEDYEGYLEEHRENIRKLQLKLIAES